MRPSGVAAVRTSTKMSRRERQFAHRAEGLAALVVWLTESCGDVGTVAVGIELPHGAVVETLLEHGFAVYAVNPKQLDRFRDRHSVAGAKDDRLDAFVLADALRTDQEKFRRLSVPDKTTLALREVYALPRPAEGGPQPAHQSPARTAATLLPAAARAVSRRQRALALRATRAGRRSRPGGDAAEAARERTARATPQARRDRRRGPGGAAP